MKNTRLTPGQRLLSLIVMLLGFGLFVMLFVLGIFIFSWVFIVGAVIGLVIFIIGYIRARFFAPGRQDKQQIKPGSGNVYDHDEFN